MAFRWIAIPLSIILLSACSSAEKEPDEKSPGRRAAELNTQLGQAYMERGEYEIALEKLKRAVCEDGDYAPAHTVLAVLYERIGESENAGRHYKKAIEADPTDGNVNNNYGAFLCRNGDADKADPYFLNALKDPFYRSPEAAMANAGSCALERGDAGKAESYFRQALSYDPEFPDALLGMAGLNYESGKYLNARGFLQRYEARAPMTADSLMTGYLIETRLNNSDRAAQYANRLLDLFPDSRQAVEIRNVRRG